MTTVTLAEYVWLDGTQPTQMLRSKARAIAISGKAKLSDFPDWGFDGSSTNQAVGEDSDCILKPVNFIHDPIRGVGHFIVMCEVFEPNGQPHASNHRAKLRQMLDAGGDKHDLWVGFEQEYTLFHNRDPLGWPENGFPAPQGPYYCGVGAKQIFGRDLVEAHAAACCEAGIAYCGLNAEVMPGQWEFQVGYRGVSSDDAGVLNMSDQTWLARWLLHRIAEDFTIHVSFDNKPIKGDWNGAGMHTNFSTRDTRDPKKGKAAIKACIDLLAQKHDLHIKLYGSRLQERLTGAHETCDIDTFKAGTADRGASIRIPSQVAAKGYGYLEDRRPGANADPYLVSAALLATIAGIETDYETFALKHHPDVDQV